MTTIEMQGMPLIDQLAKIIIGKVRHSYYDRVVKLAEQYRKIITNEDTDSFFQQVIKRETPEWFEQRKRLTNLILGPLSNTILSPLNKVKNSHDLKREIKFNGDANGNNAKEFEEILRKFAGESSLDDYTRNRFLRLSDIDPNAWIVVEWPTVDKPTDKRTQPYPFEVSAAEAIMFEYVQYELQYLVVLKGDKFTIYGQNQTVVFTKIDNDKLKMPLREAIGEVQEYANMLFINTGKNEFYQITVAIPHNLGRVPAKRTGYRTDAYTNDTTYVNTFHVGLPYILDTVKAKSEKDLQFALTVFALSLRYDIACPECGGSGVCGPEAHTCKKCNGKKTLLSTSVQEAITLPMPRDKEDFLDLNSLITWSRPPTDIIDVMLTNLDSLNKNAFEAVWGKNTFVESAGTVTAEQIISQENSKYDNLKSCAKHLCDFWTFTANVVADVVDLSGVDARMSVGEEFNVLSQEELTARFKTQKEIGMGYEVTSMTEREIMKIMHSNEPQRLRKYEVKTRLRPFADKSADQINIIIANKSETTLEDRILWQNYEQIWDGMEMRDPFIYDKPIKDIKSILDANVKELIRDIKRQQSVTGTISFEKTTGADGTVTDVEAEAKANLKGTVGGVQGIIEINAAVSSGQMSPNAAKTVLIKIYGFTPEEASAMVELPEKKEAEEIAAVKEVVAEPVKPVVK